MKIRGHGNGVAIALAALAVVIAGGGTAFAVSATTVHIEDGYTAGRFAHVDTSGHVLTTGATSTIDSTGNASNLDFEDNFLTSPTTATLAVSKLSFSDPSINSTASSADVRFYLYKAGVNSSGKCSSSTSVVLLGLYSIAPGDDFEDSFPAPLIVKPVSGAKYCLDLYGTTLGGSTYNAAYDPSYNLTAYVIGGSYTGTGANAVQSTPAAISRREKTATSR